MSGSTVLVLSILGGYVLLAFLAWLVWGDRD